MSRRLHLDWPPVWLLGFMAAVSGLARLGAGLGDSMVWPGRVLILAGFGLMIWAGLAFMAAKTTIVPHERPRALVESGPYRFSRNPIYLADLMILAGWALVEGSLMGLALVPVLGLVLEARFIRPEEAVLEADLGEPYRAFRERVSRWI